MAVSRCLLQSSLCASSGPGVAIVFQRSNQYSDSRAAPNAMMLFIVTSSKMFSLTEHSQQQGEEGEY